MKDSSAQAAVQEIGEDRVHGAAWLMRRAVTALAQAATESQAPSAQELLDELRHLAQDLARARPDMAAIANGVGSILHHTLQETADAAASLRQTVVSQVRMVTAQWDAAVAEIARHAAPLLRGVVLTHSQSATVAGVLEALKGQIAAVVVTESRPLYEGRAAARRLAEAGLAVTLITEAQAGYFMPTVDAVVVGADTVFADGAVVNKTGSYPLALLARQERVPFFVLSESFKITFRRKRRASFFAEEREPQEVLPEGLPGVRVRNVYFDLTPGRLVTAVITERGALRPREVKLLAQESRRYWQALFPPRSPS